jgi:hypothetical protein
MCAQSFNVGLSSATCAVLVFIAQIYPNDQVLGVTGKTLPWAYAGQDVLASSRDPVHV